ncbi:HEAT repeat domain-containing protein [Leucobacter sp. G161]|uniref:HEAT repeat domain-containing protein n=1 Tax=Leucobacter sp. G161 TaxID=663704 RepID=UPI00073B9884|nr:hypothetical protein [Leucobacter sp. G161]KUF05719.1 hypothetical protein AUL38_15770 [Leucobacter sp. G161]
MYPKIPGQAQRLTAALASPDSSVRLQAAMTAGSTPARSYVAPLVARGAVESDFAVREMLTWALIHHPRDLVLELIIAELRSASPGALSQALHTISKLGDSRAWSEITPALLHAQHDEVARSAWRAGVTVVPAEQRTDLAVELVRELGRGDRQMHRSLSRALVALDEDARAPLATALRDALAAADAPVIAHVRATERLLADPDAAFALDPVEARQLASAYSGASRAHQ